MALKSDAKCKEKLTCGFKYDMKDLVNFTQPLRSTKVSLRWAIFVQSISGLSYKNTEKLSFMTLNIDCGFKNGIINWVNRY